MLWLQWRTLSRRYLGQDRIFWLMNFLKNVTWMPPNIIYPPLYQKPKKYMTQINFPINIRKSFSADFCQLFAHNSSTSVTKMHFVSTRFYAKATYSQTSEGRKQDTPDPGCWAKFRAHTSYWDCSAFRASNFDWIVGIAGIWRVPPCICLHRSLVLWRLLSLRINLVFWNTFDMTLL